MSRKNFFFLLLAMSLLSLVMHSRVFRLDIMGPHSWRQTQTQQNTIHFATRDFNLLNPRVSFLGDHPDGIRRMELPVFQWINAGVFRLTGESITLTRIFVFLIGLISMLGAGLLCFEIFRTWWLAVVGAWALCFSPQFYYYTLNPMPDMMALSACIWGSFFYFRWLNKNRNAPLFLSVFFLSLGALCKLPFGIFFALFGGWLINRIRERKLITRPTAWVCFVVFLGVAPVAVWYGSVISGWTGNNITTGMLGNELSIAELADIFFGHLVSTLPELMLNYAAVPFFALGLIFYFRQKKAATVGGMSLLLVGILGSLYFIFELNTIRKVHDYYLLPFLPLLVLLVVGGFRQTFEFRQPLRNAALILLLICPVTAFLLIDGRWDPAKPRFNPDLITYRQELIDAVPADAKVLVGEDPSGSIWFYYIRKRGWNFNQNILFGKTIHEMRQEGLQFVYSDSRETEQSPELQPFLGELTAEYGSIRIYKLK